MDAIDKKAQELLSEPTRGVRAFIIGGDDDVRDVLAKGDGPKSEIRPSNVIQGLDETERAFSLAGAIEPPYNPATLTGLFEHSNSLRPNVDAYCTNIDAHGHRFEPVIDLDGTDADQRIEYAMAHERQRLKAAIKPGQDGYGDIQLIPIKPNAEEVKVKRDLIKDQMQMEKTRLEYFFEYCCADMSFSKLRRQTRQDFEVIGNGFWEVLRNGIGEVAHFTYVPGFTVRLLPLDPESVDIELRVKVSDLDYDTVKIRKRFRKYIQVFESRAVFFKEFGDPRIISRGTGQAFPDIESLLHQDPKDGPATEILHFRLHNPRSSYGVPRWTGQMLSVLGSRQAEEINYLYFENKSVPPLALLVSGGRVSQDTVNRLRDHIENEIKGKKNFHKMMVIEAVPDAGTLQGSGQVRIVLQPLTQAQQNDMLFQNYDERNIDKVGNAFRLPRLLRGDVRDFNRATAEAALEFAEQQVFGPEREEFDFVINRKILPELGARFHKFRSNAPKTTDPKELSEIITAVVKENLLTPEEGRELLEGVFNKDFKQLAEEWTKQPMALTLAQLTAGAGPAGGAPPEGGDAPAAKADGAVSSGDLGAGGALVPAQGSKFKHIPAVNQLVRQAKELIQMRKALLLEEQSEAIKSFAEGKPLADSDVERIYVTREQMQSFVIVDEPTS